MVATDLRRALADNALLEQRPGMVLVEIFLPKYYEDGTAIETARFLDLQKQLAQLFGGVTAFVRSSASGLWYDHQGQADRDEIAIFEVMTPTLDRMWWQAFRQQLESDFRQQEVLIRATNIERI